jgi:hypothetical protein
VESGFVKKARMRKSTAPWPGWPAGSDALQGILLEVVAALVEVAKPGQLGQLAGARVSNRRSMGSDRQTRISDQNARDAGQNATVVPHLGAVMIGEPDRSILAENSPQNA